MTLNKIQDLYAKMSLYNFKEAPTKKLFFDINI